MLTENVSTLKIHKLTQEQYDRELAAGNIDESALYLTPDEEINLTPYATKDDLSKKADTGHTHDDRYYTEAEIDSKIGSINSTISSHNHDSKYDAKGSASSALASAKSYADSAATTAANKVKNDLLNGAGAAYDTLSELGNLIDDNVDAIEALEAVAANKSDKGHIHSFSEVSGLQSALDGKAATSHGTHVSYGTSASALGTSSAGSASTVSRSDHVHALPALTSCTGTLTVAKGGTGATTSAGAITNLGAMDLTSAQTASGVKTFSNGIKIGNATLTYDSKNKRMVISVA